MKRNRLSRCLIGIGMVLILAAGVWFGYNIWTDRRAGESSAAVLDAFPATVNAAAEAEIASDSEPKTEMPTPAPEQPTEDEPEAEPEETAPEEEEAENTIIIDGDVYLGRLDIPSIGLALPVMSEWNYNNLNLAPCRYSGAPADDNFIIAGHNYSSHFGSLRYLFVGDAIYFTDADGNVFTYEVAQIEELGATDIEAMENSGWPLTLFTCTIGGKARLTVRCELKTDES
jgi:sortase A